MFQAGREGRGRDMARKALLWRRRWQRVELTVVRFFQAAVVVVVDFVVLVPDVAVVLVRRVVRSRGGSSWSSAGDDEGGVGVRGDRYRAYSNIGGAVGVGSRLLFSKRLR